MGAAGAHHLATVGLHRGGRHQDAGVLRAFLVRAHLGDEREGVDAVSWYASVQDDGGELLAVLVVQPVGIGQRQRCHDGQPQAIEDSEMVVDFRLPVIDHEHYSFHGSPHVEV